MNAGQPGRSLGGEAPETASTSGRYQLLRPLGGGGMAEVHEAIDRVSGRHVALKRPHVFENPEKAERAGELFAREFHVLAQLAHPRVVEVYDYGVDERGPYYTMELLDGGDLEQLVRSEPRRVCALARDVCSALSLLHSRRIVHRDVSPRNVRCTSDGLAKLIDFGAMTRMGVSRELVGTPVYCAPEVLNLQPLDGRADLYALGATLYYVLTGHHAYPVRDFAALPGAWQLAVARPSELVTGSMPEGLDDLVLDLLQLNPDHRPSSAAEVMERLSAIEGRTLQETLLVAQSYLCTPAFVGREQELARVRSTAMRVSTGHGSALLVRGAAGVGRSRFLDQNVLSAKLLGLTVLRADAQAAGEGEYGVMRRLLHQLERLAPELLRELVPPELPVLGHVFPELPGARATPLCSFADRNQLRPELQAALLRLLCAMAGRLPLLLAVDDLHDADEPSLATLAMLAAEAHGKNIMLLCTALSAGAGSDSLALRLYGEAARELVLHNLSESEALSLLGSVFGTSQELDAIHARLYALALGSPRDLMRLAQHLVDNGVVRYQGGAWYLPPQLNASQLPASVSQLLAARVRALDPSAAELACALALCPDKSFSRQECLALAGHGDSPRLLTDLDRLSDSEIVSSLPDERYQLADEAWVPLLTELRNASELSALQLRLAGVFKQRSHEEFRTAQHLLRGGRTREAVELFVAHSIASKAQTDHDPEAFFEFVRTQPRDWAQTYMQALAACRALGRPRSEAHALRIRLGGLLAVGLPGASPLPTTVAELKEDCGLADWERLDASLPPAARLGKAIELASARYAALPEHARLLDPRASMRELTVAIRYTLGASAPNWDVEQVRALPSLAPFAVVAPVLAIVDQLRVGVLMRITGRIDDTRKLYAELLDKLDAPGHSGLDESGYAVTRVMVLSALATIEAGLGLPGALAHAPVIARNPLFVVNAMQLRMQHHLWQGERRLAEECRRRVGLLRLQNSARQNYESGHLVWQLVAYVAKEDTARIKQVLGEIEPLAAVLPGWRPALLFGRAEHQRIRGDYAGARAPLDEGLAQLSAGDHLLWVQLAAADVRALDAAGQSDEAAQRGAAYLLQLQAAELGDSARQYLLLPLAVAQARAGLAAARGSADAALAHLEALGASGLNLFLAHEASAWVAVFERDRARFEQSYAQCEPFCNRAGDPALSTKLQRLRRAAQRVQLAPSAPLPDRSLATGVGETIFRSRISSCASAAERASTMLALLVQQSGSAGGHLLLMRSGYGPALVASQNEPELSAELHDAARQFIQAELAVEGPSTDAPLTAMPTSMQLDGALYRPVLLSHYADAAYLVTGLALLRASAGQPYSQPVEVAARISRLVHDLGDSTGVSVTELD